MLTHGITSLYSTAQCHLTTTTNQRSNYSIIYEGAGRAIASLENFLRPPKARQKSHFGWSKCFLLQFHYRNTCKLQ